jgi:tRNA (cytidine/uridine-2'-O-)-methyltransferase
MIMRPIPGGGTNAATRQENARHLQNVFMYPQAFNRPIFLLTDNRNLSRVGRVCRCMLRFFGFVCFSSLKSQPTIRERGKTFMKTERHVVLVEPEIHWNTGNIGRTCLAAGAKLHLIEPLGFSLSSRAVKRAGLDYWPKVKLQVWKSYGHLERHLKPKEDEVVLLTKSGEKNFWSLPKPQRLFLVFGSETRGLPQDIIARYRLSTYYIPISSDIRSLNLSTAVGIALYESLRHSAPTHAWHPVTVDHKV